MNVIYEVGHECVYRIAHMGRQEWLLISLAFVLFGYYCAKVD